MTTYTLDGETNGHAVAWTITYQGSEHSKNLDFYRYLSALARDAEMTYDLTMQFPDNEELNRAGYALDCQLYAEQHYAGIVA